MSKEIEKTTTHFGYNQVSFQDKTDRVADVFHSVASKYDIMNDLMSFGLHRLWKRFTIDLATLRPGQKVLDVAAGSGDLAKVCAKIVGKDGKVIVTDINESMLTLGRTRLEDQGLIENLEFIQANAEELPFIANYFDLVTIAFGLRNVTHPMEALTSMYRVLKPGGKILILEFSHAESTFLKKLYDLYSFNVIPKLGELITQDKASYQYLVESIRMHPNQETLKAMMLESGFEDVEFFNLNGGIVALHRGYKY